MKILIALVFLMSIAVTNTSDAAEVGAGYGLGMRSCGEFARFYATTPIQTEELFFTWAEGFMSGLNFMAAVIRKPSRVIEGGNASMKAYQSYIRNYCDNHPLAQYSEAVTDLWMGLPPTMANSK